MSGSINDLSWHALGATMMDASQASRLGEAAKARTDTYQSGLSHGASRFFKGLFSFGINEIWRAIRTSNYNKDMAKIASGLENFYNALAPRLELDPADTTGMTLSYDGVKREGVEVMGEKVTVERFATGGGKVTVPAPGKGIPDTYDIDDCDKMRADIELDVMRHARYFKKEFVKQILKSHKDILERNTDDATVRHHGILGQNSGTSKALQIGFSKMQGLNMRDKDDLNAVPVSEQNMVPKEAAKTRLRNMLAAFYEGTIGLPPEVGRTLDIDLGLQLVPKVLNNEITAPDKLKAFLDAGSKEVHLADAESQKLFAQFEKASKNGTKGIGEIEISGTYTEKLHEKGAPFVPKGEQKEVHDFVADLILNEDVYDYDKDMLQGQRTGARLSRLVEKHMALVAKMMDPECRDGMLKTLNPKIREIVEKDLLVPLENDFQKEKSENPNRPRKGYLEVKLTGLRKDEAKQRATWGTADLSLVFDGEMDRIGETDAFKNFDSDSKIKDDGDFLGNDDSRAKIQKSLDFFGTIEADIDKGIGEACADVQKSISGKLDGIFKDTGKDGNLSARELKHMSLENIKDSYSKEQDVTLLKAALNVYFAKMPKLAQRQMMAAQTRFCMYKNGSGDTSSDGVQLGAMLKGAGPVMQKMLQGVNPEMINDPDMKVALEDMKDNLAPISEKAINACLYDIIQQSRNDPNTSPIERITVQRSLGQASVGQALLCVIKRQDMEEEKVVVKLLRPNANLAARREEAIFLDVAKQLGKGMENTFKGRYKAILAELDLKTEAQNSIKGAKVYDYSHNTKHPFTNVKSAMLAPGCKPSTNTMVQQCAEGTTLKKLLTEEMGDIESKDNKELLAMQEKLRKTHSALANLSYMWTQEGLFGAGFYHGDLHEGNIMVDKGGALTVIDFGNATTLNAKGRVNVIRVVSGMAVCDTEIFMKGYAELLESEESRTAFAKNREAIKAKLDALLGEGHKGIADTALRLDLALKILQMDFNIEVPSAVHNFLESQRRLNDAMINTQTKLKAVNAELKKRGKDVKDEKLQSMMSCLIDVVKQNIGADLLKAIGVTNAMGVYNSIKDDLKSVEQDQSRPSQPNEELMRV